MKPGTYVTEIQAAEIMQMSVDDFRRQLVRDYKSPTGFTGEGGETFFVRGLVENYRSALSARFGTR